MTRALEQIYGWYNETELKAAQVIDAATIDKYEQKFDVAMCGSCRKVHTGSCAIPDAPYYVLSNDREDTCVVPCASIWEANEVVGYIERRKDQKYIRIAYTKPRPRGRKLSLLLPWRYHGLNTEIPMPEHFKY